MNGVEPDLISLNVSHFEFSCRLRLGRERIREIMRKEKVSGHNVLIFSNSYQIGEKNHFASAFAHPVPYKPDQLLTEFTYSIFRTLELRHERVKPVTNLVELLAKERTDTTFRCTLTLRYPSQNWESPVRLPFNLLDIPSMPFDEIRGFRAVKFANGRKTKYSIVVDRPENKDYHHSVTFSLVARCDPSVIEVLLREGVSVSRQFVRPRSRRASR